jgi:hypothetical protein
MIFMNGEAYPFKSLSTLYLKKLADDRDIIFNKNINEKTINLLYEWYVDGFLNESSLQR